MSLNKILVGTMILQIVVFGSLALKPTQAQQPATPVFDHSNCQYPDRWTNPANGCDNSDPAVPECIKAFSTKAGEDACIAAFVAANQPPQQIPSETITGPGSGKPSECGVK